MHHVFFICLCVSGCLGCHHVLATVNNAAVNIGVHEAFEQQFRLDMSPGVESLDHVAVLFLVS